MRKPDGLLGYTIYRNRKPKHLYLHATSHTTYQKCAILPTATLHVKALCDPESLHGEIQHLKKTFRKNGYCAVVIH